MTIETIGWTPFETTTYNDVKWMARKIAAISHDDIKYAFEKAEFPKEVQDLYVHKISARRNEIIKAFDLEKEFPLYQVPNLDHYSPNKIVKNGKITVKTFDGYTTLEHSRQGFNLDIFNAITQALPLNTMSEHFNAKISGSSALNFSNYESFVKSGDFSNGISHKGVWGGVGVSMNRRVMLNNMHAINVSPENTHGYLTIDTISVEFNIGSGLFGELFKDNPLGLDLNLNVFKREYTMIQPANSLKDALLNALRIPSFVLNNRDNIVFGLHANEYVMIRNGYGFSASVSQSIPIAQTGMSMSINPSLSWNHSDPVYFGRDSFGQLFVYKEDASSMTFGLSGSANIGQRNIPLIKNMPLISESFYTTWYNFDSGLYLFKLPEYVLGGSQLDFHHYQQEYNAFNEFMNANSHDPVVLARRAFTIDGKGRQKKFNLDILKFFIVSKLRIGQKLNTQMQKVRLENLSELHIEEITESDQI